MKNSITIAITGSILLFVLGALMISIAYSDDKDSILPPMEQYHDSKYEQYREFYYKRDTTGYYDTVIFTEEDSILSTY